eukprot:5356577-Amphidinium_carterae.1
MGFKTWLRKYDAQLSFFDDKLKGTLHFLSFESTIVEDPIMLTPPHHLSDRTSLLKHLVLHSTCVSLHVRAELSGCAWGTLIPKEAANKFRKLGVHSKLSKIYTAGVA